MDIRIKRTKALLESALFDLIKTKPIEKITPTELCRKATINRNTFYSHYTSVKELYDEIENNLIDSLDNSLNCSNSTIDAITVICKMLKANQKLSAIAFSRQSSLKIMNRAFEMTDKFNMNKMNSEDNSLSDNYKKMLSSFTIMGSAAVLECWVKNGMIEEPEDIARFIYSVSKNGSSAMTKS